jgi:hypothetical protein
LAKPNYQYEKRQKELAKKAKQEEKRRQKLKGNAEEDRTKPPESGTEMPPPDAEQR